MPAITVENPLTLPAVTPHADGGTVRPVLGVVTAPTGFEG